MEEVIINDHPIKIPVYEKEHKSSALQNDKNLADIYTPNGEPNLSAGQTEKRPIDVDSESRLHCSTDSSSSSVSDSKSLPPPTVVEVEKENLVEHQTRFSNFIGNMKRILIAGTGFLCDAYDLFVINLVLVILKIQYPETGSTSSSIVSTGALWGAVVGQLVFGFVADRVGRKIGFIITLTFIIVGAFGSCSSVNASSSFNIYVMLMIWRTILGFGIGGEYPLSATISSETAVSDAKRGKQVASVFSMQGVGIILSPIVVLVLLHICGPNHIDVVWRLALAFGGIPGLIMIYFRIKMKETTQFKKRTQIKKTQMIKLVAVKYWKTLLGTAGSWLIFDITFYANGLFNATIVSLIGLESNATDFDMIVSTAKISIYLALLGLPGYFVGVFLIDKLGRRKLQLIGFLLLSATYLVMGLSYKYIVKIPALFIILYGLTFFFSNAGPNTTTFVLPSESFPTKVRATCHGISAACGKIGAVIGAGAIAPIFNTYGGSKTLIACACIAFAGFVLTFFVVKETMGRQLEEEDIQLEEISDQKQKDFEEEFNEKHTSLE